jgi:macrolide transport system ATP-binding/permease protein
MKGLRALLSRLLGLLPDARRERELADELEGHLQMHIDDNLRRGMSAEEARREALMRLGGVEPIKQIYRERRSLPFLENLMQDIRFALRQLRKNPGFTATAIFILALGMCASVAIFAFVDAALIKPLPYLNPTRLVGVFERIEVCHECNLSYFDYLDWKKMNKSFSSLDVYQHTGMMLSTAEGAKAAKGARVSDGFFRTLGVTPALGRDFYTGEDLPQAPRTVLVSYAAWQQRFGGKPDVLGQKVILNGEASVIIGVLPRDFHFAPAEPAEFWTALHAGGGCESRRGCHDLYGVARLKDGVSIETALADVKLIAQQLETQYPDSNRGQGGTVAPLVEGIVGTIRPILLLLMGGAGLLLLIATVNVASLLLVRSESRRKEISVRTALGASLSRLAGQFVTEGLVLVAAGSALGVASAIWAMQLLTALIPAAMLAGMPYLRGLGFNIRVSGFAGAVALMAVVLFSVTPTLHFSLSKMREGLTEGSRGSAGRSWTRVGAKLVVMELATAMVLLVGAGLLGKSLYRLLHVDIGIQSDHLVTMQIASPKSYAKAEKSIALERLVASRIEDLPGVTSVGIASDIPISHWGDTTWIRVLGRPWHGEHNEVPERNVSVNYFQTLGAKLERGRFFDEAEDASKPRVAIINHKFATQYFPGEDPIGKQVSYLSTPPVPIQIIGIVEDLKEGALDTDSRSTLYIPFNQNPDNYFNVVVRTSRVEQPLIPALAAAIHKIDPEIVTSAGETMTDRINGSYSAYLHRSSAWLVGGFAALALLLGVVGLYGVVAYSVSQRTREIGIRMALGAQRGAVYRLVLKEAGWLTSAGIAIGLGCSVGAAILMRGLLFGVRSWDAETLAGVAVVLGISALFASYIPARRAASVNPVEALHTE